MVPPRQQPPCIPVWLKQLLGPAGKISDEDTFFASINTLLQIVFPLEQMFMVEPQGIIGDIPLGLSKEKGYSSINEVHNVEGQVSIAFNSAEDTTRISHGHDKGILKTDFTVVKLRKAVDTEVRAQSVEDVAKESGKSVSEFITIVIIQGNAEPLEQALDQLRACIRQSTYKKWADNITAHGYLIAGDQTQRWTLGKKGKTPKLDEWAYESLTSEVGNSGPESLVNKLHECAQKNWAVDSHESAEEN